MRRLVKQGALSYHRAMTMLAELQEELGDLMAEALQEVEDQMYKEVHCGAGDLSEGGSVREAV